MTGAVTTSSTALASVARKDVARYQQGNADAQDDLRQVAGKVRVQPLDTLRQGRRELAGTFATGVGRSQMQHVGEEPLPEIVLYPDRSPLRRRLPTQSSPARRTAVAASSDSRVKACSLPPPSRKVRSTISLRKPSGRPLRRLPGARPRPLPPDTAGQAGSAGADLHPFSYPSAWENPQGVMLILFPATRSSLVSSGLRPMPATPGSLCEQHNVGRARFLEQVCLFS